MIETFMTHFLSEKFNQLDGRDEVKRAGGVVSNRMKERKSWSLIVIFVACRNT